MELLTTAEYLVQIDKHADAVYVLHEKSERRFPVHHHIKDQLTYVEGGIAYVHLPDKTYVIPARHYIWMPQGLDHRVRVRFQATAIRTIYFNVVENESNLFYRKMGIYPVNNLLHEMVIYTERWNGHIHPADKESAFMQAIRNILPELSTQHLPIVLPTTSHERLLPILRYMDQHTAEPLTLTSMSEHFGLSERTLSRLFQSNLSISFLQYLKQLRMVKAVELMLQTDLTLSQIAFATGYNSLSAFSNTFYQLTNTRPSDFAVGLSGNKPA